MTFTVSPPTADTNEAVIISGPLRGQIVSIATESGLSNQEAELLKQFAQVQRETAEELEQLSNSMQAFNRRIKEKLEELRR